MKVAITGAGGFVGRPLVARLRAAGDAVLPLVRAPAGIAGEQLTGPIEGGVDWAPLLAGTDALIHLAARVHVMRDRDSDPLAAFRRVNTEATISLAQAAAEAGVRRFLFLSTIKVHGEATENGRPFRRADAVAPSDPYAVSKFEAEQSLTAIGRASGMEIVIIRAPLIHGPGAGGNLAAMMSWLKRDIPLPLGGVRDNRRSLVGIDNLIDLIMICLSHPGAADGPWLVSDGSSVSTAELIELIAAAMGQKARLFSLPPALLGAAARLVGRRKAAERLLGSLEVDMGDTVDALGWRPPLSLEQGIARMAAARSD